MHPEEDEEHPTGLLEPVDHLAGERADERDRDPERDEHDAEPEHERDGVRDRPDARAPGERRLAGDVDEERRHEREDAR